MLEKLNKNDTSNTSSVNTDEDEHCEQDVKSRIAMGKNAFLN